MELKPIYQIILIVLILILFIVIIYLIVKFKSKVSDENNSNVKPENETKKFEEDVINSNVKLENETKKFEEDVINLMIDDIKNSHIGSIKISLLDKNKNEWKELFNKYNIIINNPNNINNSKQELEDIKNRLTAIISFGISVNERSFKEISYNKFAELIKQVYDNLDEKLMFIKSILYIEKIDDPNNVVYFQIKESEVTTKEKTENFFHIWVCIKDDNKHVVYLTFNPINDEKSELIIGYRCTIDKCPFYHEYGSVPKP